ncbi:MAG: PQQ-like beta-propeller repeat protein [Phycisphaerales bacterium]|nr:MAG: PQQ-like beta-propeller repeat protein [Phycisphaerales bacterium]
MLLARNSTLMRCNCPVLFAAFLLGMLAPPEAIAQWTQFGGPNQAFKADSKNLARVWPAEGPRKLWSRELGDGYSSILADGGRLYTMYRGNDKEIVVSLDAATGKTLWEYAYDSLPCERNIEQFGRGPRATPLLTGGRLCTIGIAGVMHCLDADTGSVLWSHDFVREFGGFGLKVCECGYSSSPIEYKDTVIALVGGKDQAIIAFSKMDGTVVWRSLDFEINYSTPKIMKIHGEDQVVALLTTHVVGVEANTGKLRWQFPCVNEWRENATMPVLVDANTVLISGPAAGSRCLKITKSSGGYDVEEAWSTRKLQIYHGNSVQLGDHIYASGGVMGPHLITALNVRTGKTAWRKRGFGSVNLVYANGRFIILDEDGSLSLATANPDDLTVHSQVALLEKAAWTAPTLVGTTLFVRDRSSIMALDLSR